MKLSNKIFAVIFAISMFVSANAFAAVDMTDAVADVSTFASEIKVSATTGTDLANPGNIFDTTAAIGFGQAIGNTYYVRYNLSNSAEFKAAPTSCTADGDVGTLAAGGAGESYAIYSITVALDAHAAAELVVLVMDATGITVFNESGVTLSYAMYETAGQAVAQTSPLASDSEAIIAFDDALVATVTAVTSDAIDVTAGSLSFDDTDGYGTDVTMIGDVNINVDGATLWTTGVAAAMTDLVAAGTSLVLTGSFGAALDVTTDQIYIDTAGDNCGTVGTAATTVTATTATFVLGATPVVGVGSSLCMAVDEATAIGVGAITALYDVTVPATSDLTDKNLGTLTTLAKNGATDSLNFALKPTTEFTNLVRITNTGTAAGDVYITLINDAGDSVQFDLADVEGYTSSALESGASTAYINITALYAAAQAADATFDNNSAQLRVNIDSTCTAILITGLAMSKDNNVFTVIDSVDNATN